MFWLIAAVAAYAFIPPVRQAVNAVVSVTLDVVKFLIKEAVDAVLAIVNFLVKAVQDILDFIGQWLAAMGQLFQGDIVKAILRIVSVAAFLWVWERARDIPVIGQLIDTITQAVADLVKLVNGLFDQAVAFIDKLRQDTAAAITNAFGQGSEFAKLIRDDVLRTVNQLFGRLAEEVQRTRFEVLAEVDLIRKAQAAQITLFGQRIALIPDEVRRYLNSFYAKRSRDAADVQGGLTASLGLVGVGQEPATFCPWEVVDAVVDHLHAANRGGTHPAADAVRGTLENLAAIHAQTPPECGEWPYTLPPPEEDPFRGIVGEQPF